MHSLHAFKFFFHNYYIENFQTSRPLSRRENIDIFIENKMSQNRGTRDLNILM